VRVEFLPEGSAEHPALLYGLKLKKNRQAAVLYFSADADFRRWKQFLGPRAILGDFFGRFRLLQQIGKGSFAQVDAAQQVFLVEDAATGERFAAKRFDSFAVASQKKGRQSLLNEVSLTRQLDHENLVKLHQVQETGDCVYLVLELCEGPTLHSFLKQHRSSLAMEDFKRIIQSVLAALAYLSSQDVIHRDLKPENLLFKHRDKPVAENTLKLIDFGLATRCHESEYLFKRCGTPGYASPEVINARSSDKASFTPKCDVFSAGILLYELYALTHQTRRPVAFPREERHVSPRREQALPHRPAAPRHGSRPRPRYSPLTSHRPARPHARPRPGQQALCRRLPAAPLPAAQARQAGRRKASCPPAVADAYAGLSAALQNRRLPGHAADEQAQVFVAAADPARSTASGPSRAW